MPHETGCSGQIVLGKLSGETRQRLTALPGEWLEFDPGSGAILVRHCQPSLAPCLPAITGELERMLAEVPTPQRARIPGGDLYVHTESKGQLVRLRVEPGGDLRICWAQPDYSRAERRRFSGGEPLVAPEVQRLNGCVSFGHSAPAQAVRELQSLADSYLGLYPEGEFLATADQSQRQVQLQLRDVNLDAILLMKRLEQLAGEGTLSGRIEVSSFAATDPEQYARFLFEGGKVWIERPALWGQPSLEQQPSAA